MELFEWDQGKELENRAKHGIGFAEAKAALQDPGRVSRFDSDHSDTEDRFLTVGCDYRLRLITVLTTDTLRGTIRIISARRATKRERYAYELGWF